MKKLSDSEFENLAIRGKGRSSQVFNSIINLRPGEAMLIEKKDWKRKAAPGTLVRYIEKNHNMRFVCGALNDGSGWAVKRVDENSKEHASVKVQTEFINERLQLKSDILIFYIGRMAFHKIERIEDSTKAAVNHFWKEDNVINGEEKEYVFLSEPQLWFNATKNFSIGSEIELSSNFAGLDGFNVMPTVAAKWTF